MKGFFGRLLRVDLAGRTSRYDELPDSVLGKTLGGKGLGTHLLLRDNPVGVDPLSPEAVFVIAIGPATGTAMWSQSRYAVFAKSPATGGFGESYCGGGLAPKIKACGIDAVILTGRADMPVWLSVTDSGVVFHDARDVWGRETFATENVVLAASPPNAGAMTIGPAGENRVAFACIKSDRWRSLGRGGMGAVLGAKNVKALTFAGTQKTPLADEGVLREVIGKVGKTGRESSVLDVYRKQGTPSQVEVTNTQKCFPTRYWQSGVYERWPELSADYMAEHFEVRNHGCPNCFLQCTKRSVVKNGRHAGLEIEGPEYETIYAIGGLNEIAPLEEVAYLNDICDRLGLDTISAGNASAFAIEAHKRGKSDHAIDYGQPEATGELYGMIARREGVGDVLADGVKTAAEHWGLEEIAVHAKGLEPAGFDPRVLKGMGLSYATAARGACHLRGTFYKAELTGQVDKDRIRGKAEHHIDYEDRACLFDSLILCRFFRDFILWDEIADIIRGTMGLDLRKAELERIANEITQRTREYNRREGLGPETDVLSPALHEANAEGAELTAADLAEMVGEYDAIRESR